IADYGTGERSLGFFGEKMSYQWTDPTFGARKTIITNDIANGEPDNPELFHQFYNGNLRHIVFKLSIPFMIFVYLFSLIAGIYVFMHIRENKSHLLIQLFLIGGFLFQLIWESLSRYCLPYYLRLIVEAVYGVFVVYSWMKKKADARNSSKIIIPS
ncbi:MAG: hypothetical protein LBV33_03230, partial [Lachnospiraceae bacterium]|nr:hypothetical protein [Lachnospiraceae bacterium]